VRNINHGPKDKQGLFHLILGRLRVFPERCAACVKTQYRAIRDRKAIQEMSSYSLSDIGLNRTNLERADSQSLFRDPSVFG
jgi:uncharacterized protein YjiS (DUF1127 family)